MRKLFCLAVGIVMLAGCNQEQDLGKTNVVPDPKAQAESVKARNDIPPAQKEKILAAIQGATQSDGKGLGSTANR